MALCKTPFLASLASKFQIGSPEKKLHRQCPLSEPMLHLMLRLVHL